MVFIDYFVVRKLIRDFKVYTDNGILKLEFVLCNVKCEETMKRS